MDSGEKEVSSILDIFDDAAIVLDRLSRPIQVEDRAESLHDQRSNSARIGEQLLWEGCDIPYIEGLHWEKKEKVGSGMFGTCYRAIDVVSKEVFCIKVMKVPSQAGDGVASRSEIDCMYELQGIEGIVEIYGWFVCEYKTCILMEYVPETLEKKTRAGKCSTKDGVYILQQILQCITKMYDHGLIHQDIKEENVGIVGDAKVVLLDFGQAKRKENMTKGKFREAMLLDVKDALLLFHRVTEKSTDQADTDVDELFKEIGQIGKQLSPIPTAKELLDRSVFRNMEDREPPEHNPASGESENEEVPSVLERDDETSTEINHCTPTVPTEVTN